jgi:hypothetical protein
VNFVAANRQKIDAVARELIQKREIYGDDLLALLDRQQLVKPEIDWSREESWPRI